MNCQRPSRSNKQKNPGESAKQEKEQAKSYVVPNKFSYDKSDEHYEDTMTKPLAFPKIKISFDEEETKNFTFVKGFSSLANHGHKAPAPETKVKMIAEPVEDKPSLQIPYNKKVEEIMSKKPLRQRLSGILPPDLQLSISYDHQQLIKRMELIDRTVEFLGTHRGVKLFFFDTIRKSIFETSSIAIDLKLIQQLLFLDENCYQIQWAMNQKIKRYDIKITLPRIQSMDVRKSEMRRKIVQYLIYKEGQLLADKKLTKVENNKWHDIFDYKRVQIPEKTLPVHPTQTTTDLRAYAEEEIDKISNPVLKMLFKNKKNASQVKSLSSASVADMIFSKVPANEISNKILNLVKEKEKINNEERQKRQEQGQKVDKQAILKIYDEILLIYMSKNVSNIFKVTLIELLQQRLQLKNEIISEYVEKLLKMEGMDFLKVIQSSKKIQVVQIDKQKYKDVRALVSNTF